MEPQTRDVSMSASASFENGGNGDLLSGIEEPLRLWSIQHEAAP